MEIVHTDGTLNTPRHKPFLLVFISHFMEKDSKWMPGQVHWDTEGATDRWSDIYWTIKSNNHSEDRIFQYWLQQFPKYKKLFSHHMWRWDGPGRIQMLIIIKMCAFSAGERCGESVAQRKYAYMLYRFSSWLRGDNWLFRTEHRLIEVKSGSRWNSCLTHLSTLASAQYGRSCPNQYNTFILADCTKSKWTNLLHEWFYFGFADKV